MNQGTDVHGGARADEGGADGGGGEGGGDKGRKAREIDALFGAAYEELRRLAGGIKRGDGSVTITPTVLVNEVWLRLARSPETAPTSRERFLGLAAHVMRHVLVEAARRRRARKRGGDAALFVTFDEAAHDAPLEVGAALLELDDALSELAKVAPRQARVVELRFFGGLTVAETAAQLGRSEALVERDWRAARAYIKAALARRA